MVKRKLDPNKFLTEGEKGRVTRAIREAEKMTSGEIRVFLDRKTGGDLRKQAERTFEKLGMTRTQLRNGVLIYISLSDHKFVVLGDRGIHEKVGENFWQDVVSRIEPAFSRADFAKGLEEGMGMIGEKLKAHFPYRGSDVNELPDEIGGN